MAEAPLVNNSKRTRLVVVTNLQEVYCTCCWLFSKRGISERAGRNVARLHYVHQEPSLECTKHPVARLRAARSPHEPQGPHKSLRDALERHACGQAVRARGLPAWPRRILECGPCRYASHHSPSHHSHRPIHPCFTYPSSFPPTPFLSSSVATTTFHPPTLSRAVAPIPKHGPHLSHDGVVQ